YYENFLPAEKGQTRVRSRPDPAPGTRVGSGADPGLTPVFGEMHIRRGFYVGVAPVPGGLTNVCLVKPSFAGDSALADPAGLLTQVLARDPLLRDRAAGARLIGSPVILGPLAVDVRDA